MFAAKIVFVSLCIIQGIFADPQNVPEGPLRKGYFHAEADIGSHNPHNQYGPPPQAPYMQYAPQQAPYMPYAPPQQYMPYNPRGHFDFTLNTDDSSSNYPMPYAQKRPFRPQYQPPQMMPNYEDKSFEVNVEAEFRKMAEAARRAQQNEFRRIGQQY